MVRSSILLLLVILLVALTLIDAKRSSSRRYICSAKRLLKRAKKTNSTVYQWPSRCKVFTGDLLIRSIDLASANFRRLHTIHGRLIISNTKFQSLPSMPRLVRIHCDKGGPGIVILNNYMLRDIRGLAHWSRDLTVTGTKMPIFISGNPFLETATYQKMFHKPYSPISCERRLTPQYNVFFAEEQSLKTVIFVIIFCLTIFLYPLSAGSANVYFVPGYHKY